MSDPEGEPAVADAGPDGLVENPAASAGLVAAGVGLVAAFLPWTGTARPPVGLASPAGAVLAALAAGGFLLCRQAALDRRLGAGLAGAAGAGLVLAALSAFVGPAVGGGEPPRIGPGLPLSAAAGVLCVGFAVAGWHRATASGLIERARRTAVGLGLVVGSFLLLYVVAVPLQVLELGPVAAIVVGVPLTDAVFAAVALWFLVATGRGLGFVDVRMPGVRDVAYAGAGLVALFGGLVGIVAVVQLLGLPVAGNNIADVAREGPTETLLLLVPLSWLLVGPAEELLYRNVVQKYLYGAFSRPGAVVVASGLFAAAHLSAYSSGDPVATLVSLTVVFVLSLVLGVVYERTGNLVVPAFIHGTYNAALFALLYVAIEFGDAAQAGVVPW